MRIAAAALAASLTLVPGLPARAEAEAAVDTPEAAAPAKSPANRADRLDALFETLASARDESAARKAEREIVSLWLHERD